MTADEAETLIKLLTSINERLLEIQLLLMRVVLRNCDSGGNMRTNIYSEELTHEIEIVHRTATSHNVPFIGLRIYLKSPPELSHTKDDDDRSAITFWFDTMAALNDFRESLYTGKPKE